MRLGTSTTITFYRGRERVGQLGPGELTARVAGTVTFLRELGVCHGDRVAIASPNCLEVPVLLLAVWQLGAIAVPLNPNGPSEDWCHILKHSGARGCFASRTLIEAVSSAFAGFVRPIEDCERADAGDQLPSMATDEPAIILYTSGTTAQPKGVMLSRRNLSANASAMARNFSLSGTTQLATLPLYHAHALGFGLMTSLATGGHLVFTDRFDPLSWAEVIRAESVTVASLVPPMLPLLLQARITRERVPTLEALLVSSAPLPTELARQTLERARLPLVHGWGLSEFTNFACCLPPELDEKERCMLLCGDALPSVGAPLDGCEVTVRDECGRDREEGAPGELCVRGPSRMLSYYRDEEATRRALTQDWLRTGDLGFYRLHRGKPHFYIAGRLKEIIIRGGEKYSPIAIEERLIGALPELTGRLVVLGFTHALYGEEVGAYLESDNDALASRILQAIERLPVAMRPKVVVQTSRPIPRTHTGKIQRRKLAPLFEPYSDHRGAPRLVAVSSAAPLDSALRSDEDARSRG
jgi:long-chain acyl-CoA synthetase